MSIIWSIIAIAFYTSLLLILYRQSYNYLFFLLHRPKTWILSVALIGILNMGFAYLLGWNPRIVGTATLLTFLLNIASSPPSGTEKETRKMVKEIYKEWGLPYGRLQEKTGWILFGISSLISHTLLFGEYCNKYNECTPLFLILINRQP